jgi:hypothetical protein
VVPLSGLPGSQLRHPQAEGLVPEPLPPCSRDPPPPLPLPSATSHTAQRVPAVGAFLPPSLCISPSPSATTSSGLHYPVIVSRKLLCTSASSSVKRGKDRSFLMESSEMNESIMKVSEQTWARPTHTA